MAFESYLFATVGTTHCITCTCTHTCNYISNDLASSRSSGLAPEGVERSSRPEVAPRGDTVYVTVHWDLGTDLELSLDFGDNTTIYTWDWQVPST